MTGRIFFCLSSATVSPSQDREVPMRIAMSLPSLLEPSSRMSDAVLISMFFRFASWLMPLRYCAHQNEEANARSIRILTIKILALSDRIVSLLLYYVTLRFVNLIKFDGFVIFVDFFIIMF